MGKAEEDFLEAEALEDRLANLRSLATMQDVHTLMETIQETLQSLMSADSKKEFYDKELGKQLSESLDKLSEAFKKIEPPDLSAITKSHDSFIKANEKNQRAFVSLVGEISAQNKSLISAIESLSKAPADDNRDKLVAEALNTINKSNALISKGLETPKYDQIISLLEKILDKKPPKLRMEMYRKGLTGKLDFVILEPYTPKED